MVRSEYPSWEYEGFKYLDVESSAKKKELVFLPLIDGEIGATPFIEWGLNSTRFGFLQTLDKLIITPFGNRNNHCIFDVMHTDRWYLYR